MSFDPKAFDDMPDVEFGDETESFTPRTGSSKDLLSMNGEFPVETISVEPHYTERSGNHSFKITAVVTEDGADKGKRLTAYVPFTGVQAKGKNAGRPNMEIFDQFLYSCGVPQDKIQALKGKKFKAAEMAKKLLGPYKNWVAFVGAEEYQERWSSNVISYVGPKEHQKAKAVNSHRTNLPAKAQAQYDGKPIETAPNGKVEGGAVSVDYEPEEAGDLL